MLQSWHFLSRRRFFQAVCGGAAALTLPARLRAREPGRNGVGRAARAAELADEIDQALWNTIVPAWFPRCSDGNRGFHERFDRQWNRQPATTKCIVYQARMTWTAAFLALRYPEREKEMLPYVDFGRRFLETVMWDDRHGGFHERVVVGDSHDEQWETDPTASWKNLYGQAFGVFAAATAYEATGLAPCLELAKEAFFWLESHMYDCKHGGYFEHASADGQVQMEMPEGRRIAIVGRLGCKSMNAHIHILEALAALYRVWRAETVRSRLEETFRIVRDKIVAPDGHLVMFADRRFTPIAAYSSFGHELETAYLLHEASELLELHDEVERTRRVARTLVDHSMRYGQDREHGGFYNEGPATEVPEHRSKIWWVEAESFNGLLTAHRLFGGTGQDYFEAFDHSWRFFKEHMVDDEFGGCYSEVAENGARIAGKQYKANPWKTAYHVVRGMVNAAGWLRE